MKDVLMSPKADGPKVHYYMIRGGKDKKNITVWESGTVGGEYIKSYGHYHVGDLSETYEVLAGEGYVILQRRAMRNISESVSLSEAHKRGNVSQSEAIDDEIVEFRAIKVKEGDKVFIPSGYGHLAINTGKSWLVTEDDSPVDFGEKNAVSNPSHADYAPFKKLHGAAYYCVEENLSAGEAGGSPKFVKNPNYKTAAPIEFK